MFGDPNCLGQTTYLLKAVRTGNSKTVIWCMHVIAMWCSFETLCGFERKCVVVQDEDVYMRITTYMDKLIIHYEQVI